MSAAIADVIASLSTLPGDWRVAANVAGNLTVIAPTGAASHYLDMATGQLHAMSGDMGASLQGQGKVL